MDVMPDQSYLLAQMKDFVGEEVTCRLSLRHFGSLPEALTAAATVEIKAVGSHAMTCDPGADF